MKFSCKNVFGGWQTEITFPDGSTSLVGPVFNAVTDLWEWQKNNLVFPIPVLART